MSKIKTDILFHMGKMRNVDSSALKYEADLISLEYAVRISEILSLTKEYRSLQQRLPSRNLINYFQNVIQTEIYPYIAQACVVRWYKRNNNDGLKDDNVYLPRYGIFPVLLKCWRFGDVGAKQLSFFKSAVLSRSFLRDVKARIKTIIAYFPHTEDAGSIIEPVLGKRIACAFVEGLDFAKRNDLNWFFDSGIDPKQVLIYFDMIDSVTGKPVSFETIAKIEDMGFSWVVLTRGVVVAGKEKLFKPQAPPRRIFLDTHSSRDYIGRWVAREGNKLIREVNAWQQFYKKYNIGILYTSGEVMSKYVIQRIAFDAGGPYSGVFIGKQRSETYEINGWGAGNHSKHVFFSWSRRVSKYLTPERSGVDGMVVSGFPYNISARHSTADFYAQTLKSRGAKFIIALFDNSYDQFCPYSPDDIAQFYEVFLSWAINDPDIGIIIKSKGAQVIGGLVSVAPLLAKAIQTGRCIKIEDERGRLPSDASMGADMAIGCGISSSVSEAVIGGCKGIHYDITKFKRHDFYKWGYERLIFDDIDRLIKVLKDYKKDRGAAPKLGDWSDYMDDIDPFHDNGGGQRMGYYMKSLLEGLNNGLDRCTAIEHANKIYAAKWGMDKIINLNKGAVK